MQCTVLHSVTFVNDFDVFSRMRLCMHIYTVKNVYYSTFSNNRKIYWKFLV